MYECLWRTATFIHMRGVHSAKSHVFKKTGRSHMFYFSNLFCDCHRCAGLTDVHISFYKFQTCVEFLNPSRRFFKRQTRITHYSVSQTSSVSLLLCFRRSIITTTHYIHLGAEFLNPSRRFSKREERITYFSVSQISSLSSLLCFGTSMFTTINHIRIHAYNSLIQVEGFSREETVTHILSSKPLV